MPTTKKGLPLILLPNWLPVLWGVHVHAQAPVTVPDSPGPYRALIDTGASHSWVKTEIGENLRPHSLEGYVVGKGDGAEEQARLEVKTGFLKGLKAKPVKGWVQLHSELPAREMLLLSGESNSLVDLVLGMDLICSFVQCGMVFRSPTEQPMLVIEYEL